ncbi:hypothetical protein, partial [Fulvimarina manganoxydans]|uniref:hypothetical protein n=1 Tax=Fulvimarina manganoxydans TaxID=937218 RepID=UPI001AECC2A9
CSSEKRLRFMFWSLLIGQNELQPGSSHRGNVRFIGFRAPVRHIDLQQECLLYSASVLDIV